VIDFLVGHAGKVAPRSRQRGVLHTSKSRIQPPAKASLYMSICIGQSLIMLQTATRAREVRSLKSKLGQKGVSASNAKKPPSYNPVVVQFPYDMSLANILIPSNDEKRRLMFELRQLVAFLSEGHDTGSKTALPMCFHFTSKPSIPDFESSLIRTTTHHGLSFGSSSSQLSS